MQNTLACLLAAMALTLVSDRVVQAADADVSIVINPRTGAAELRNDSDSSLAIDGYLLVAPGDTFNPATWSSLQATATSGWLEGQANDLILSEVNIGASLPIPAGGTVPLGAPYDVFSPSAIGQPEPTFAFTYSVENVGVFQGEIEFSLDNNLVLVVDQSTGGVTLENQSIFDVSIDSYVIQSPTGILNPGSWSTLAGAVPGWVAAGGSATRLGEGNLEGSTFLAANGGSLDLGMAVDPGLLTDETDLILQYSIAANGPTPGLGLVGGVLLEPMSISEGLPGDHNNDGRVDSIDYAVWREGLGVTFTSADLDDWKNNFGATAAASTGSIVSTPEPTSFALATLALVGGLRRNRRVANRVSRK